jgi:NitT/TauT family transport system permease protein
MRRGVAASALLFLLFLAGWQWGPGLLGIPHYILPPLSLVIGEFFRMWSVDHLAFHTAVTAMEVIAGFALGSLLGACIGYLLGMSPTAEVRSRRRLRLRRCSFCGWAFRFIRRFWSPCSSCSFPCW